MVEAPPNIVPRCPLPVDEPFAVNAEYADDKDTCKVNLGIGVYRTEEGLPWPLSVVDEVQKSLQLTRDVSRHEYLSIQGDPKFLELARDLAFDFHPDCVSMKQGHDRQRIVSVQTVSGTGANHVGAKYLSTVLSPRRVWLPSPTWSNHTTIWQLVGVEVHTYPYYSEERRGINFVELHKTLANEAATGDVVLLHACAHNPTGSDPSREQWSALIETCERRGLVAFLDLAYQGFASGDVSEDAWVVKEFFSRPSLQFCVAQSFSKNFGLYGQRAGALHVVIGASSVESRENVLSHLCHLIRGEYSTAPRTGSDIVRTALENESYRKRWKEDLRDMSSRIKRMREALYDELQQLHTPGSWEHIIQQVSQLWGPPNLACGRLTR